MSDTVKIRMIHIRQVTMCSRGARLFFERHNLDWQKFLDDGINSDIIEATGDPMALAVVEVAKNGR